MNINMLLVLDTTDNTLCPIGITQNYNNYMDFYKEMLSVTNLTQKDISIDEFVKILNRRNKTLNKADGYNIKHYILFYI